MTKIKITPNEIIKRFSEGETQASIAKDAGVTKQMVSLIIKDNLNQYDHNNIKLCRNKKTDEEIKAYRNLRVRRMLESTAKNRWHWNYLACTGCGKTDKEMQGFGYCTSCYTTWKYNNDPEYHKRRNAITLKYVNKQKSKFPEKYRKKINDYMRNYYRKKNERLHVEK